jgi:DNA replication protein DnaC
VCYGLEDGRLQQLRRHLAYLKLAAAAKQLPAALKAAQKTKPGYTQFLHNLLDGEVTATQKRRLASRLRLAEFPSTKTLEEFDFTAQSSLDRRLVDELASLPFIKEKANVLAIGPPGRGSRCFLSIMVDQGVQGRRRELRCEGGFGGPG